MTTITIKNGKSLSKNKFDTWEDFQMELILMQENIALSAEHIKILLEREKIAAKNPENNLSWKEVKTSIKRKNV